MTVASETYKVKVQGNGVAATFSFAPIVIQDSSHLQVTLTDADGEETLLSEGPSANNYSVTVSQFPGTGSIRYPAVGATRLPAGQFLTIKRVLPFTQPVDLENQGGYFPEVQEQALDRGIMIALQQQEEIDRSLKAPVSDDEVDLTLPAIADRASMALGFDEAGLPVAIPPGGGGPGIFGDLALKDQVTAPGDFTATGTPDATTFLRGDNTWAVPTGGGGGDPGGDADTLEGQAGAFYLARGNHTGTQAISTVTGLQTALDDLEDFDNMEEGETNLILTLAERGKIGEILLSVKDYGATGDGVTDDTDAIQDAIDAASAASALGGICYVPPGKYIISDTLLLKNRVWLMGSGRFQSWIFLANGSNCDMIRLSNQNNEMYGIENLFLDGNRVNQGADNGTGATNYRGIVLKGNPNVAQHIAASAIGMGEPEGVVHNVFLKNTSGDSMWIEDSRHTWVDRVTIISAGRRCWFSKGADSHFSNIELGTCQIGANVFHNGNCAYDNVKIWGSGNGNDSEGATSDLWNNIKDALDAGQATSGYNYPNRFSIGDDRMAGCGAIVKDTSCSWSRFNLQDTDGTGLWYAGGHCTINGFHGHRVGEVVDQFPVPVTMSSGSTPPTNEKYVVNLHSGHLILDGTARGVSGRDSRPDTLIRIRSSMSSYDVRFTETVDAYLTNEVTMEGFSGKLSINGREIIPQRTSAQRASAADPINTQGKRLGRLMYDSTLGEIFVSPSATAVDDWKPLVSATVNGVTALSDANSNVNLATLRTHLAIPSTVTASRVYTFIAGTGDDEDIPPIDFRIDNNSTFSHTLSPGSKFGLGSAIVLEPGYGIQFTRASATELRHQLVAQKHLGVPPHFVEEDHILGRIGSDGPAMQLTAAEVLTLLGSSLEADAENITVTPAGDITETDVQAALEGIDGRVSTLEEDWAYETDDTNAVDIDASTDKTWLELTHSSGTITVTFTADLPAGASGALLLGTSETVDVEFEAAQDAGDGALYLVDGDNPSGTTFEMRGLIFWECVENTDGDSALIVIQGRTDQPTSADAAHDANGHEIGGYAVRVVTASGSLTMAEHGGAAVITSGNVTVPTEAGFSAEIIAGGTHTVTFNGDTSSAMTAGDIMSVVVEDATTIHARLTPVADQVSFS